MVKQDKRVVSKFNGEDGNKSITTWKEDLL